MLLLRTGLLSRIYLIYFRATQSKSQKAIKTRLKFKMYTVTKKICYNNFLFYLDHYIRSTRCYYVNDESLVSAESILRGR